MFEVFVYSHVDIVLQDGGDLSGNLRLEPLDEGLAVTVHKSDHLKLLSHFDIKIDK